MKKALFFLSFICLNVSVFAQAYGNAGYNNPGGKLPSQTLTPQWQGSNYNEIVILVQGLYNEVATKQVAIFSITQIGKTTSEVNALIDEKIDRINTAIDSLGADFELFTDMISFVPMYAYEREKKLFNKKTYNEIPAGFEVKKNLHIGFRDGNRLNEIVAICAENEVFDLVRVAYVSTRFEAIKDSLRDHTFRRYSRVLDQHQRIHNIDYSQLKKSVNEGFQVSYPMDSYQSYQAFSQPSLDAGKNAQVKQADKPTTLHYVPAYFEQHEFVMNPEVIEPTIQLVYSLEVRINLNSAPRPTPVPVPAPVKTEKKILFLTPQGDLKTIQ
jgi:hypothetical protein